MPAPIQTFTAAELAKAVAVKLNVFGPDEFPDAASTQLIEQAYRALYEEWFMSESVGRLVTWDPDLIPLAVVESLKVALCARCAPDLRGTPFYQTEFDAKRMLIASQGLPASPAPTPLTFI